MVCVAGLVEGVGPLGAPAGRSAAADRVAPDPQDRPQADRGLGHREHGAPEAQGERRPGGDGWAGRLPGRRGGGHRYGRRRADRRVAGLRDSRPRSGAAHNPARAVRPHRAGGPRRPRRTRQRASRAARPRESCPRSRSRRAPSPYSTCRCTRAGSEVRARVRRAPGSHLPARPAELSRQPRRAPQRRPRRRTRGPRPPDAGVGGPAKPRGGAVQPAFRFPRGVSRLPQHPQLAVGSPLRQREGTGAPGVLRRGSQPGRAVPDSWPRPSDGSGRSADAFEVRVRQGVVDTVLEGALLADAQTRYSVPAFFDAASEQAIGTAAVRRGDLAGWPRWGFHQMSPPWPRPA